MNCYARSLRTASLPAALLLLLLAGAPAAFAQQAVESVKVDNGALQLDMYTNGSIGRDYEAGGAVAYESDGSADDAPQPLFDGTFVLAQDGGRMQGLVSQPDTETGARFGVYQNEISPIDPSFQEAPDNEAGLPGFDVAYRTSFEARNVIPPYDYSSRIYVDHRVYASTVPADQDYVILDYVVGQLRESATTRSSANYGDNLRVGLAMDFNLGVANQNAAGFDAARNLLYAYDVQGGQKYYGIVGLRGPLDAHSGYYAGDPSNDTAKQRAALTSSDLPSGAGDVRLVAGYGPFNAERLEPYHVRFALVAGDDLPALQRAAERALSRGDLGGGRVAEMGAAMPGFTMGSIFGGPGLGAAALGPDGEVVLAGGFSNPFDVDPSYRQQVLHPVSEFDAFLAQYDDAGGLQYGFDFDSRNLSLTAVAVDDAGNTFITGMLPEQAVDLDPGPGVALLAPAGSYQDLFVAKYDASGAFRYGRTIGGPYSESGRGLAPDGQGGVYVTGGRVLLAHYTANGTRDLLDDSRSGTAVAADGMGRVYVAADEEVLLRTGTSLQPFLTLDPSHSADITTVELDEAGNVYLHGTYRGILDFDLGPGEAIDTSSTRSFFGWRPAQFVAKYASDGSYVYAESFPDNGVEIRAFAASEQGEVYLGGHLSANSGSARTWDLDPGAEEVLVRVPRDRTHGFVTRLDAAGRFAGYLLLESEAANPGSDDGDTYISHLLPAPDGRIATIGRFTGKVDLNPDPLARQPFTAVESSFYGINPSGNLFVARLDASRFEGSQGGSGSGARVATVPAGDPPPTTFPDVGIEVDFSNLSGETEVVVERFEVGPDEPLGLPGEEVAALGKVWRVSLLTDRTFAADLCFSLDGLLANVAPMNLVLRKRETSADPWGEPLPSALRPDEANPSALCAIGVSGFSEFVASTDRSNALPVELASFEATSDGAGAVRLAWRTASETGNDRFEVERRSGSQEDGMPWTHVTSVPSQAPAGTSAEALAYTAIDRTLPFEASTLAYRLVQFDLDGTREIAGETVVEIGAPQSFALYGSFPNPVRGGESATLRYELPDAQERVQVEVFDALGRRVAVLVDGPQESGRQEVHLDVSALASGVYFYRLRAGSFAQARRLTVIK